MKKIILTTGGTGGHYFAAIAVYDELVKEGYEPLLITDERCKKYASKEYNVRYIDFKYKSGGILNKIKLSCNIFILIFKVRKLLKKIRPNLIIGFGGYTSIPGVISAYTLKVPIIVHEQNLYLGKTNKLLSCFANRVTVSFQEFLQNHQNNSKYIYVGMVVRKKIVNAEFKHQNSNEFKILIFGGSQGAKSFTDIVPSAIQIIANKYPQIKLNISQQVSDADRDKVEKILQNSRVSYNLSSFFVDIINEYQTSDLVIARSGASTIGELCNFAMPAILIPYPYAAEDHQLKNAILLQNKQAAYCIESKDLNAEMLAEKIICFYENPSELKRMSDNIKTFSTDGALRIVDTVVKKLV